MRPAEIPFSIQLLKIQEPCPPPFQMVSLFMQPLVKSPLHHNIDAPAALTVVMKRGFHQGLHAYKGHLLKFPFHTTVKDSGTRSPFSE